MHELKQLVDDSLEKLPVGSEEARVLSHNVHDIGRYDGLVVLPSLLLTQAKQVLSAKHAQLINAGHRSTQQLIKTKSNTKPFGFEILS